MNLYLLDDLVQDMVKTLPFSFKDILGFSMTNTLSRKQGPKSQRKTARTKSTKRRTKDNGRLLRIKEPRTAKQTK